MTTQTLRTAAPAAVPSGAARWTGRTMSALAVLFLLFDAGIKLARVDAVRDGMAQLGYAPELAVPLGTLLLACTAVYALPRTAFLGALLLTGYLGGAVATHVRAGSPLPSHTLFPVYVALFVWGGLFLRDPRLRALVLPPRTP